MLIFFGSNRYGEKKSLKCTMLWVKIMRCQRSQLSLQSLVFSPATQHCGWIQSRASSTLNNNNDNDNNNNNQNLRNKVNLNQLVSHFYYNNNNNNDNK